MINFLHTHWIAYASAALIAILIWLIVVLVKRWKQVTKDLSFAKRIDKKLFYLEQSVDDLLTSMTFIYMPDDKIKKKLETSTDASLRFLYGSNNPLKAELKRREMMRQEGQKNE